MHYYLTALAIVAGICFATGLFHLFIGLRRRGADMKHFTFGLFAVAYGGAVLTGMLMYGAGTLPAYLAVDRWSGLFAGVTYIFLIWFVAVYTEARPLTMVVGLTLLFATVIAAHVTRPTMIHGEILGIAFATLPWGEQIAFLEAAESTWEIVFFLTQLLTIGFLFYACIRQYRRGERRAAQALGTGLLLFVAVLIIDMLVESGIVTFVLTSDFGFLPLAMVMSFQIYNDIIRTEEELAHYRQSLEALVQERTAELETANAQLAHEMAERIGIEQALRQSEAAARALINASPDSAFLLDRQGVILDLNNVAALRLGVKLEEVRGRNTFELFEPELGAARRARFDEAIAGKHPVRWQDTRAGYVFESIVYPILDERGEITSVAAFAVDITERTQAEAEVQAATQALRASEEKYRHLVEEINEILYTIDSEGIVTYISPAVESVMGYSASEVVGWPFSDFIDPVDLERLMDSFQRSMAGDWDLPDEYRLVGKSGEIVWLQPSARPIVKEGERVGLRGVLVDVTARVRAEESLRKRAEELAVLNRIAHTLATVVNLPAALKQVSEMIAGLFDASYAYIVLPSIQASRLQVLVGFERGSGPVGATPVPATLLETTYFSQVLHQVEPLVLSDVQSLPIADSLREFITRHQIQNVMLVPLIQRGIATGFLAIANDQAERVFAADRLRLAETIAGDIAAAIENARLFEQAQAAAAAEERSRLARDLHDAATQTIYSATLIAEALPKVWARDPAEGERNLVKLRQLVRGALAEMRTLLFELRPWTLGAVKLSRLLEYLANSLTGRTRIPVEMTLDEKAELPEDVKVALYRIAQEASNNVAKHARATQVRVTLRQEAKQSILSIEDDGQGFDPAAVPGEKMGLQIMDERAADIGATLTVESAPGEGTRIAVVWSPGREKSAKE